MPGIPITIIDSADAKYMSCLILLFIVFLFIIETNVDMKSLPIEQFAEQLYFLFQLSYWKAQCLSLYCLTVEYIVCSLLFSPLFLPAFRPA